MDETPRRTFVRGRDRRLDLEPLLGNSRSFTTHGDGARDQCLGCRCRSAGSASTRALPSQRPIFLSATEILANGWKMTRIGGRAREPRVDLALLGLAEGFGDDVTAKNHANGWLLDCVSGLFASLHPNHVVI